MKKILLLLSVLFISVSSVFAADYVVKTVKGKVQFEAEPGVWKDVQVGQVVADSTNLNTSLNSFVVLDKAGKEITVKAMQKGTVDSLTRETVASNGIKKGAIKTSTVAGKTTGSSKGVSTASSRASDAKADLDWAD